MQNFFSTIKLPGTKRIVFGSLVILTLFIASILGTKLSTYSADYMDGKWIMEPPSIGWLRSILVTKKGLANLQGSPGYTGSIEGNSSPAYATTENNEDYNFLDDETSKPTVSEKKLVIQHKHYFGTDKDGRDMLALLIAGAKTCLLPGLVACLIALGLGIPLGVLSGYYGKLLDKIVSFVSGVILSFPRLILILIFICALEPNVYLTMGILGLTISPSVANIFRTRVQTLSKLGFVLAAKESGISDFRILTRHIFWYQCRTVFFIQLSLIMAESILVETTLSYLQFGTKPPNVSWGNIIEGSRLAFFSEYYWITFFPAVAIVLAILGFYYLGDGLNARLMARERS